MSRARLLVADDHELFREGLVALINSQPDMEVVAQAGDGLEALEQARRTLPDLIVMDIRMPVFDGLEATRRIRSILPEARILMLTVHDEDENLFDSVRAGACGYLLKSIRSEQFLEAVRAALDGQAVLPPRLAMRLLEEFARLSDRTAQAPSAAHDALTARERQVLDRISQGASDRQIAAELSLSIHTVKTHVRNILAKLHAVNRHHAARLATDTGAAADPQPPARQAGPFPKP